MLPLMARVTHNPLLELAVYLHNPEPDRMHTLVLYACRGQRECLVVYMCSISLWLKWCTN